MEWQRSEDHRQLAQLELLAVEGTRRAPRAVGAWLNLAAIYRLRGSAQDVESCLDAAAAIVCGDPEGHTALAAEILALGEPDRALAELEQILAASPDFAPARRLLLTCLLATTQYARAHALTQDGVALDAAQVGALAMLRDVGTSAADMLVHCDAVLAREPHHVDAKYYKAIALAQLGRTAQARAVIALDDLVQTSVLPVPAAYGSGEAFRAALAAEMLSNPTLAADPRLRSTRQGRQVANLFLPQSRASLVLAAQIEEAVEAYLAAHKAVVAPARAKLVVWGVVLGAEGYQKSHRHPAGWLSGVTYVAAPKPPPANAYPGRLLLGALDHDPAALSAGWGVMEIEPVPGTLVIFPSHIPHSTEPSGMAQDRISVAFDVVPLEW
ncbi:MAG: putative 2OG-Fe(II) oxygenase [Rhizomicrobium sp.]